ncbi:MAG: hypothetical protein ABW044_03530 [Cellvibrio sp.]
MNIKFLKLIVASVLLTLLTSTAYAQTRVSYTAVKANRGNTVLIPLATVISLCGDIDGCEVRMGMNNWDGTGRTASRHSLFYYNQYTRNWRAEDGDTYGTVGNNVTEHVMNAWACYLTDGYYNNWTNHGDLNQGFSVLSWNQYNANCTVTLID